MKNFQIQLVFSFVIFSFFAFSQSNTLVVFSQDPTPFHIILDGVKQNEIPETRVVVPGIQQTNSSVQIYFKDESIPPVSKTIWWDEEHKNDEVTYRIVPTKKGYKLRFFSTKLNTTTYTSNSSTPPPPPPTQNVQPTTTTTTITETTTVRQDNTSGGNDMNMNTNMNSGTDMNGGNISMNINVNDGTNSAAGNDNLNMSMNINMNEGNMNGTDLNNGSINVNMNMNDAGMNAAMNEANTNMNINMSEMTTSSSETNNSSFNEITTTTVTTTTINETQTPAAPVSAGGCLNPVQDMGSIMAAIDEESFDDGKIIVAKQATSKKCLTVDQIKQIMEEFSFSKNKLDFAKYAYKRCYNPDDYYQVNSAFDFSSEKEELNEFIEDQH